MKVCSNKQLSDWIEMVSHEFSVLVYQLFIILRAPVIIVPQPLGYPKAVSMVDTSVY